MAKVVYAEGYGSSAMKNSYAIEGDGRLEVISTNPRKWNSISQFFTSVFLPQGYPESVSSDYLQYQIWDTIQAFFSSITSSLATQAVLSGFGVGDETATVMAATITWLLKDGTGMLGRIWFAWIQGSYLDCDCKRWRLFADILNDLAVFLDILSSVFLTFFRTLVCFAGITRAIVGVAGSATRAAITQHQARRNNMADVSAKDGSQETLVNLAGLICSLIVIPLVSGNFPLIWTLFFIFTCLHLCANYWAVTAINMETFNQARLHIVVDDLMSRSDQLGVLGVKEANSREPVLWRTRRFFRIHLGCSVGKVFFSKSQQRSEKFRRNIESGNGDSSSQDLFNVSSDKNILYLLAVDLNTKEINIALHTNAGWQDQLKACYQAEVIEYCYKVAQQKYQPSRDANLISTIVSACKQRDTSSVLQHSNDYVKQTWETFVTDLEKKGWKTSPVLLNADEWRVERSSGYGSDGEWKKAF